MKKQWRKALVIFLSLLMLLSVVTGCQNKEDVDAEKTDAPAKTESTDMENEDTEEDIQKGPDISEEVTIRMNLISEPGSDFDLIYGEDGAVNKLLKEDINAKLEVQYMTWGNFTEKYPLMLAAREDIDFTYSSDFNNYSKYARDGAWYEITPEMLETYAPQTWATAAEQVWEEAKVDDKIYMIPAEMPFYGPYAMFAIRKDLREKYGLSEVQTAEDLEAYFSAIAENEDGITPYAQTGYNGMFQGLYAQANLWGSFESREGFYFDFSDGDGSKLIFAPLTDEYMEYAKMMRRWAEKGFWSKSAISEQTQNTDAFKSGKSACVGYHIGGLDAFVRTLMDTVPGAIGEFVDFTPDVNRFKTLYIRDGVSILAGSKNPERTLMLIDLLKRDERYYDLTYYGIEGVHYELDADPKYYIELPDAGNWPAAAFCPWGWLNAEINKEPKIEDPAKAEVHDYITNLRKSWDENLAVFPKIRQFAFNDESVSAEYAAVNSIMETDGRAINLGMQDAEVAVPAMLEKLQKAGIEKVMAEFQAQMDAFLAE
jgi:putative aldouronate transport system substrate-binding protein